MDSDRKSTTSSFYRGRADSFDALGGAANPTPRQHQQGDDVSSFFGGRNSQYNSLQAPSAGYNQSSFLDKGRSMPVRGLEDERQFGRMRSSGDEEKAVGGGGGGGGGEEEAGDPGWDVYNDFNNQGPKYSEAFGTGLSSLTSSTQGQYQKIPNSASQNSFSSHPKLREGLPPSSVNGESQSAANNVELVTVPAFGPDWKKSEIEGMRKATKKKEENEERRRIFKAWWRDERGCCGGIGTRRTLVIVLFVLCCIAGIVLAITIPRAPAFAFNAESPLSNDTSSSVAPLFNRVPANFSFPALLNIQVNTGSNVIPIHVNKIDTQIFCLDTDVPIGGGQFTGMTIPAKTFQPISIPVFFNYTTVNDTDTTWLQFYNACKNKAQYTGGIRPGFNIRVILNTSIRGLLNTVVSQTQITKVNCPFELPNNAG